MKNSIVVTVFLSFFQFVNGQSAFVHPICDTSYLPRFKDEAISLTIQQLIHDGHSLKDSVLIPDTVYLPIARELSSIYHTKDTLPEVDTVFDILGPNGPLLGRDSIVPSKIFELHTFQYSMDTNVSWVSKLVNGVSPTGNDTIDYLINRYQLTTLVFDGSPGSNTLTVLFLSSVALNPYGLAKQIQNLSGIVGTTPHLPSGEHSFPTRIDSGNYIRYIFKYSFGDCNPACYGHHYWDFKIHLNCTVQFDSSYGYPMYYGHTSITSLLDNTLTISPNPTTDKLYLSTTLPDLTITITDMTGRISTVPYSSREIDVSSLPTGIYCIRLHSRDGTTVRRFVKE